MIDKKENIIEKNIRFSESIMWHGQKAYYDTKGIEAWTDDVPNYITSNPFIGRSYAQLLIAFMQDWLRRDATAKNHPFYILELGTGTGQFSFYLLKQLLAFKDILQLSDLKIRYILSDVTERPFEFWQNHPSLKPYFEQGILDFATYDLYQKENIHLRCSSEIVDSATLKNPLIVIANYLFDSIATDVFTVADGQLFESRVTLKTPEKLPLNGVPTDWQKVSIHYEESPISQTYYHNEFDEILFGYQDQLIDTHFQFPIAGLTALKNLQSLANNRLLLLTSDKGYTTLDELDCLEYPDLDFHGSFSVMVNYHAIGAYLGACDGGQHIQAFRDNIVTGVFSSGFSLDHLPQLAYARSQVLDGLSPTDYFLLYEHVAKTYKKSTFAELATFLNLSEWDPNLFEQIGGRLSELAEDGDPEVLAYLIENMYKISENFYYSPAASDVIFDIAVFYQNVNRFEEAIPLYEKSNALFGDSDVTWFNIGMCYQSLENKSAALDAMHKALQLNESANDVREWIGTINKDEVL